MAIAVRNGRRRRPHATVTIHDVAKRAGVSTATVSRALANPDRVAAATREAVISAISETGFTPNASARSLRARSTKMVLTLLPGIGNSFYTPILNAVEDVLSLAGYGMIMGDTRQDRSREAHYDRLVRAGQVDGVILMTGRLPDPTFAALDATIPITLVCNDIPTITDLPVIEVANDQAAHEMVSYLIENGHRHIAHAKGPAHNVETAYRFQGYKTALAAAGIPFDERIVFDGAFTFEAGVRVGHQFLSLAERPTAIFMANDEMAMGFIKTMKDAGVRVPQDISVAGFDDVEFARYFDPALTTMRQPRPELGRLAAENLLVRLSGKGRTAPGRTRLPCTLIVRDSVRPLRTVREKAARPAAVRV